MHSLYLRFDAMLSTFIIISNQIIIRHCTNLNFRNSVKWSIHKAAKQKLKQNKVIIKQEAMRTKLAGAKSQLTLKHTNFCAHIRKELYYFMQSFYSRTITKVHWKLFYKDNILQNFCVLDNRMMLFLSLNKCLIQTCWFSGIKLKGVRNR